MGDGLAGGFARFRVDRLTDRPLRIVHVYNWLTPRNGGPPRVIAGIAAAQQRAGHDLSFITSDKRDDAELKAFLAEYFPRPLPRAVVRPVSPWPVLTRACLLRALRGADVAHLHGIWPGVCLQAARICAELGVPYVLAPHGSLHKGAMAEKPLKKRVGMRVLGYDKMIEGAAALHTLNAEEAGGVVGARPPDRIEVIPNGVFKEHFERRPEPGIFRKTVPGLGDAPFIVFISRLHWHKGCDMLGEAFGRVAKVHPDVHLVVIGDDWGAGDALRQTLKQHGVQDRAHLVGAIHGPLKHAALCEAAVYILPSRHEGFSISITEALAWGCPVVISEGCHFPEVVTAECGLEVALDPDQLAAALGVLIGDPERAAAMGARGRALVLTKYTWPTIASRCVDLYRDVIKMESGK